MQCDLKPINILVRADGSVSIADLEQCEFVAEVRPNDDGICYIGGVSAPWVTPLCVCAWPSRSVFLSQPVQPVLCSHVIELHARAPAQGTPGFRAPEVINEQDCSFELDVWCVHTGAVLGFMPH